MRGSVLTVLLTLSFLLPAAAQELSRVVVACPPGQNLADWKLVVQTRAEQVYGAASVTVLDPHRLEIWLPNLPPRDAQARPFYGNSLLRLRTPDGEEMTLEAARVQAEWDSTGAPVFQIEFEGSDRQRLETVTRENLNKVLEMNLGGTVEISPRVMEPILNGRVILAGPSIPGNALRTLFGIHDSRLPPTVVESSRRASPIQ